MEAHNISPSKPWKQMICVNAEEHTWMFENQKHKFHFKRQDNLTFQ